MTITRKNRKNKHKHKGVRKTHYATVEGLHASFEKIDTKVRTMISSGKTNTELACCIRKAWSEQFHTSLSDTAIRGMIHHYRAVHTKQKGQKGGMGQGTTHQPVDMRIQPFNTFSPDVSRAIMPSCGQRGGSFWDSVQNAFIPNPVPPTFVNTIGNLLTGVIPPTLPTGYVTSPTPYNPNHHLFTMNQIR